VSQQSYFSTTYDEARQRFCRAATQRGAVLTSYENSAVRGPDGGRVYCDVARIGAPDAAVAMVTISGTHGVEGFCGSASQTAWFEEAHDGTLPPGTAAIHIHAINPWGMAHLRRTTERNVDLNRNFIDYHPMPPNDRYALIHPIVCPRDWTPKTAAEIRQALEAFSATYGPPALADALIAGQYSHPLGTNFGGSQREWSNIVLERICRSLAASGVRRVALIDWHTGLAASGEAAFLCFHAPNSAAFRRAAQWWGQDQLTIQHFGSEGRPQYRGLLFKGFERFLPEADVTGAVIEIGTRERPTIRMALLMDRWAHFEGDRDSVMRANLRSAVRDAFDPQEPEWRRRAVDSSAKAMSQVVAHLYDWSRND